MSIPVPIGDPHTVFLVDLSSRARGLFHVLSPLSSPDGEPIAVTAAVCTWLVNLLIDVRPAFLGFCADPAPAPADLADSHEEARLWRYWRAREWPGYKAGREPPGPEYDTQVERLIEVLQAHRIPVFRSPGMEADDWFGVLVPKLTRLGLRVVIVSKDHDLWQLVSPNVTAWTGEGRDAGVDPQDVMARYGGTPAMLPVLLALAGDGDETPKLQGIGEKGALKLIQRHSQHIAPNATPLELLNTILRFWSWETTSKGQPSKVGLALRDGAEMARLALRMVELREDRFRHMIDLASLRIGWDQADAQRVRELGDELDIAALRACEWLARAPMPQDVLKRWMETETEGEAR